MTTTRHIRASSLPIIEQCPAAALPTELPWTSRNDASDLGTAFHEVIPKWIQMGDRDDLAVAQAATKYNVDAEELLRLVESGWYCWGEIQQYFPNPKFEISREFTILNDFLNLTVTGHTDVSDVNCEHSTIYIVDWKTGWMEHDYTAQLKAYGWLGCMLHDVDFAYVAVVDMRRRTIEGYKWSADDLSAWMDEICRNQHTPAYNPGPHCGFCARKRECPAYQQQMNYLIETVRRPQKHNDYEIYRTTNPVYLYEVIGALERFADELKGMIRAEVVGNGGILEFDGKQLELIPQERKSIKAGIVLDYLQHQAGPEILDDVRVSKTAFGKRVMANHARGFKGKAVKQAMQDLEEMGAMETTEFTRLELRPVPPQPQSLTQGDSNNGDQNQNQNQRPSEFPTTGGQST